MNRAARAVCLFGAAVLTTLAVSAISWRLLERDRAPDAGELSQVDEARSSSQEARCIDEELAPLFLTASRLDPQAGVLKLDVALCFPPKLIERLTFGEGDQPIISRNGELRADLKDAHVGVTLAGDVPTYSEGFRVRLATLVGQSTPSPEETALVSLGRTDLLLIGQPDSYPLDWFSFSGYYNLHLPAGVALGDVHPRAQLLGPVRLRVQAGPGVGDFRVRANSGHGGQLKLRMTRERSTQAYVIVVLAIPVLFAFLLALGVAGTDRAAHARDALLGAVAAALALLPIRQVLVPSDIDGLTLVDWALGSIVLLFAAVALFWIAAGLGATKVPSRRQL